MTEVAFSPWLGLFALASVPLAVTLLNLVSWRRPQPARLSEHIQVLIPARNEATVIRSAIESVLAQPLLGGAVSVLVCDDGSTDGTPEVLASYKEDSRVEAFRGEPLRPGWVGKPHACQQLLERSKGDVLLFMDADVVLEPGGLGGLAMLLHEPVRARVVTAVPRQVTITWAEKWVLPLLLLTYTAWLPLRLVEWGRQASTVAANGQLMMMRRADCLALQGFTAVGHEIVDDVAFCRHAKTAGYRVVFADGMRVASCRMYDSARGVWEGFSKNLYEGIGGTVPAYALVLTLHLACFVAPYPVLLLGVARGDMAQVLGASLAVGANALMRLLLSLRYGLPLAGVLWHPLAVLCLMGILTNSMIWTWRRESRWAGRSYGARKSRERARLAALQDDELQ